MADAHHTATDIEAVETHELWPEIHAALQSNSVAEVAQTYGLPPSSIRAAVRRTGGGRTRVVRPESDGALDVAEAPAAPKKRRRTPAADKLERFAHLLGVESDGVVAEKAGVSIGTVRNTRRDRGIPGAPRRRRSAARGAGSGSGARSDNGARKPSKRTRRSPATERVKPFEHLLGVETDRAIAKRAGVHSNTVRNHRIELGIPVAPRGRRSTAEAEADPGTEARPISSPELVWRVVFGSADSPSNGLVLGATIFEAAEQIREAGVDGVLRIERVGQLL